jgi:hypothetical protein
MATHTIDRLTRREREIINALFALDNRASVEAIRSRLDAPPSDSSVRVGRGSSATNHSLGGTQPADISSVNRR